MQSTKFNITSHVVVI